MKIIVHDFSGHAFTAQLARALAVRGHDVLYASFGGFQTPKGKTTRREGDPASFRARELVLPETGVCGGSGLFDGTPASSAAGGCCG